MKVTRFIVKNVADKGTRKIIYSGTLDFEVLTGSCRIRNMRPFQIEIDEAGMIHNYSDRVMVGMQDSIKRVIRVDTMSILSIANHTDVKLKINELVRINKLTERDAILQEVDELNVKEDAFIRGLELELLLEDLLTMNKEHAIDMALDKGDVEAFNKLLELWNKGYDHEYICNNELNRLRWR